MPDRGVRISNQLLTFVSGDSKIRPLRDHIVLEPLPVDSPLVVECWKPIRGRVLATGPGCFPLRYDGPKGRRSKSWPSKAFRPTEVQVGDLVELGGKEIGGFLHCTIRWGEKEVVVCREEDVAGVVSE